MKLRKRVAKKIKALRLSKNLSQQEVAKRSGYTVQYISKLEKSNSNLTLDALERMANALEVDAGELVSSNGLLKVTGKNTIKLYTEALENLHKVKDLILDE